MSVGARVLLRVGMPLQSPNSRALIAGGTGRIGSAIAVRLQAAGYEVFAAGRADGDLRTRDGAQALVALALARLGSLDLVVHCAGDGFVPRPLADVSEDD